MLTVSQPENYENNPSVFLVLRSGTTLQGSILCISMTVLPGKGECF
jgi:hypothetical protein